MSGSLLVSSVPARAERRDEAANVRAELIAAFQRRDMEGVKRRVEMPLEVMDVRFVDAKCAADFARPYVVIEDPELAAFVGCVADIGIGQRPAVEDGDATYGPGAVMWMPVRDGKVARMTSIGLDNEAFMIEPSVFASHVKAFKRVVVPSAGLKKAIDASADGRSQASVFACVDRRGKVDIDIEVEGDAAYERDVRAATRTWSVQPFVAGKQAVPACAELRVGYPAQRLTGKPASEPEPLTRQPAPNARYLELPSGDLNAPAVQTVPPKLLERISGEPLLMPDAKTKQAIVDAGLERVIGSFKLCLDSTGAVTRVYTLKTTGFEPYDKILIRAMRQWKYRPYEVDGKPVPVCTAVTYVYSLAPTR